MNPQEQEPVRVEPLDQEFKMAELYVDAARTTTKRCYWAYSALLLVCITAILTFYAEYCSYMERFIGISSIALSEPLKGQYLSSLMDKGVYTLSDSVYYSSGNPVFEALWKEQVKNWVETQYVSIPLLGIKLSTSDVMILLSFLFMIIMAWCYYCIRSENFAVGKVLINTQDSDNLDIKKYVFYGICFNNIFFPATTRDIPYKKLKYEKTVADEIRDRTEKLAHNRRVFTRVKRYIPKLLFLLPVLLLSIYVGVHVFDISQLSNSENSYFKNLVTSDHYDDLVKVKCESAVAGDYVEMNGVRLHLNNSKIFRMCFPHGITAFCERGDSYIIWISLVISVLMLISVVVMMHNIFRYLNGTNNILYDYRRRFKNDEAKGKLRSKLLFMDDCRSLGTDGGKKKVKDILIMTSDTTCSRTFESDLIFGLTAYNTNELEKNMTWIDTHVLDAKRISSEKNLFEQIGRLIDREDTEYYILFRV